MKTTILRETVRYLRNREQRQFLHTQPDRILLQQFVEQQEDAAFEELLQRHGGMVRAVCRRLLKDTSEADDAFQITFLVLIRKAKTLQQRDLLANWLCAVAYRTARHLVRVRYRRQQKEHAIDASLEPVYEMPLTEDWRSRFDEALQRLPLKYREPIILCELEGYSRSVVAQQLGLNENTLSSRLARGREMLRLKLGTDPLAIGALLAVAVPSSLIAGTTQLAKNWNQSFLNPTAFLPLVQGVVQSMWLSQMKWLIPTIISIGLLTGMFWYSSSSEPLLASDSMTKNTTKATDSKPTTDKTKPTTDLDLLQGDWYLSSIVWDSKVPNRIRNRRQEYESRCRFDKNRFQIQLPMIGMNPESKGELSGSMTMSGTFELIVNSTPKWLLLSPKVNTEKKRDTLALQVIAYTLAPNQLELMMEMTLPVEGSEITSEKSKVAFQFKKDLQEDEILETTKAIKPFIGTWQLVEVNDWPVEQFIRNLPKHRIHDRMALWYRFQNVHFSADTWGPNILDENAPNKYIAKVEIGSSLKDDEVDLIAEEVTIQNDKTRVSTMYKYRAKYRFQRDQLVLCMSDPRTSWGDPQRPAQIRSVDSYYVLKFERPKFPTQQPQPKVSPIDLDRQKLEELLRIQEEALRMSIKAAEDNVDWNKKMLEIFLEEKKKRLESSPANKSKSSPKP